MLQGITYRRQVDGDKESSMKKVQFMNRDLYIQEGEYEKGRRRAVFLVSVGGEPYARLTVNCPECPLAEDEIIVKAIQENEEVAKAALKSGYFEDTGKTYVPEGSRNTYNIWRIKW